MLSGLCELELNLAAAIGRLRMRASGYGSATAMAATRARNEGGAFGQLRIGEGGGTAKRIRDPVYRSITVQDVMDEFQRLSSVVARKVVTQEYVVSSLLSLEKAGIILLNNGIDDRIPIDLVTMRTVVDFIPAEHEFEAAFRRGYIADGATSTASNENRRDPILRVTNRVRRCVLNPHEQIVMEGNVDAL